MALAVAWWTARFRLVTNPAPLGGFDPSHFDQLFELEGASFLVSRTQ
ncbi:MAG: hypothetical protein QOH50_2999 [Kribbellaceae bacterium]|jgi:hypothetical protein|nr:hypothetical protein [Kribbellaceae bacterium]